MDSELRRDEIELLRRLLVALTKVKNNDDTEDQLNSSSETNFITEEGERLVFALPDESNIGLIDDPVEIKPWASEQDKAVEMRMKHETFLRVCEELEYELGLLISSFLSVGGTRSVVQAASATRTLLKDVRRHSTEWIPFETSRMKPQGTIMRKALSNLAEASLQLGECLIDFGNYHGLPLQEFREWEWSLRDGARSILSFLTQKEYRDLSLYVFQSLMPDLSRFMRRIAQRLKALVPLTLPPIQSAENNATTRYLNMTTIATFFSGVTATTLQFSITNQAGSGSALRSSVNLFWLLSLVFSVASAINSLLGMTWRKSAVAPPAFRLPRWAAVWLDIAPMIFLFISAFAFAVGLAIFSFASQQSMFVSDSLVFVVAKG